jgi:hypothetical protein
MRTPLSNERRVALNLMEVFPNCPECSHYGLNLRQEDDGQLRTRPECMLHFCDLSIGEDACNDFKPRPDAKDETGEGSGP